MRVTIGVDVGGTKIAAGVVDADGRIVDRVRVPTPDGVPELTAGIADCVENLIARLDVPRSDVAVGVAAAGFVDADRAVVRFAPNIYWREYPLAAKLGDRLGIPTTIENDANAAAWAEFRFGAGQDVDDMMMITIGTGVGGGVVHAGELIRGGFGMAGEVGHIRMVRDGRLCGCGLHGCLEMYASGRALYRAGLDLVKDDAVRGAGLLRRAGGSPEGLRGEMIMEAALDGDQAAVALFHEVGSWLGEGIADLCSVLDPSTVVVGGGVAEAGELLLRPARESYRTHLSAAGHRKQLTLRAARLGNDAGIIGAADLAIR